MIYPTFAVNKPYQNEVLRIGKPIRIEWDGRYPLALAKLELRKDGSIPVLLADNVMANTSNMTYQVQLPFGLQPGKNYRVRVASLIETNDWNESAAFTLLLPPDLDYDGDSKADLALYSEKQNLFAVMLASNLLAHVLQAPQINGYALYGDIDGDSKTDPILYNSTAIYAALSSDNYRMVSAQFDVQKYNIPVIADYDGDAKADLALYLPDENKWIAFLSTESYQAFLHSFGYDGAIPVAADFDGDGKADPAVFILPLSLWAAELSAQQYALSTFAFASATDFLTPADYDADGKADPAFYRPSEASWYAALSSFNYAIYQMAFPYATSAMLPAPADYDGDGRTDLALYDSESSIWLVRLSSQNYALFTVNFGIQNAIPISFKSIPAEPSNE